jgi:hypothetical protein
MESEIDKAMKLLNEKLAGLKDLKPGKDFNPELVKPHLAKLNLKVKEMNNLFKKLKQ